MKFTFFKMNTGRDKLIPDKVRKELSGRFPDAINVEWELNKKIYEAVFYMSGTEYIARFSPDGILKEYKKNLWIDELPESIAKESKKSGEIMNAIVIFREGKQFFEVIVREPDLKRNLLLFDQTANLINARKL